MIQPKFTMNLIIASLAVLCLAACAGQQQGGVSVEPKSSLSASSVILIDPTTDDSMLPAIGESMSKGAVTIYSLSGAGAPIPVDSAASPILSPSSGRLSTGGQMPVDLRAPANMTGTKDPRVKVFSVDNGAPIATAPAPDVLTPMPTLLPPTEKNPTQLQSPFNARGEVVAKAVPDTSRQVVMGTGSRAVSVDNLLDTESTPPPAKPPRKSRPPMGMTY